VGLLSRSSPRLLLLFSLLLSLSLPLTGCATDEADPGRWHVARGFLRDAQGRAVILRGVNLSGEHKSKPYLGFHGQADVERVASVWGFNALRFLISWSALEPTRGAYDEAYLDKVAQRMQWARAAGLSVILDMHQDVYGEGFGGNGAPRWTCDDALYKAHKPTSPWFANYASKPVMTCFDRLYSDAALRGRYAAAWKRVAARLGSQEAVIGFDPINEPHWGSASLFSFEEKLLAPFYDEVVAAVREAAPGWIAFLEPSSSRNLGVPTGLKRPFAYPDVVYAPHSYDTDAEQGLGFSPAQRTKLIANIAALRKEARALDAALWIGEYGGIASDAGITAYMDATYDGAAAVAGGSMYWEHTRGSQGYGLLEDDGSEKQALLDVLVRPYPRRVAGDPTGFAFDELSDRFSLTFTPGTVSGDAPTVIAVPERIYKGGYTVSCGGCSVERGRGEVLLRDVAAAGAGPVTVTVSKL
jgi:endoglycosylceramidase